MPVHIFTQMCNQILKNKIHKFQGSHWAQAGESVTWDSWQSLTRSWSPIDSILKIPACQKLSPRMVNWCRLWMTVAGLVAKDCKDIFKLTRISAKGIWQCLPECRVWQNFPPLSGPISFSSIWNWARLMEYPGFSNKSPVSQETTQSLTNWIGWSL